MPNAVNPFVHVVLDHLWQNSWQAGIVMLLVLLMRGLFGRVLSRRWCHALWMLVLLRLALPALPSSPASVFALAERVHPTPAVDAEQARSAGPAQWSIHHGPVGE